MNYHLLEINNLKSDVLHLDVSQRPQQAKQPETKREEPPLNSAPSGVAVKLLIILSATIVTDCPLVICEILG